VAVVQYTFNIYDLYARGYRTKSYAFRLSIVRNILALQLNLTDFTAP